MLGAIGFNGSATYSTASATSSRLEHSTQHESVSPYATLRPDDTKLFLRMAKHIVPVHVMQADALGQIVMDSVLHPVNQVPGL